MIHNRFDAFESIYDLAAGSQGMSEYSSEGHVLLRPGTAIRSAISLVVANGTDEDITRLLGPGAREEIDIISTFCGYRSALSKFGMHRFPVTSDFTKKHYEDATIDYVTGELVVDTKN